MDGAAGDDGGSLSPAGQALHDRFTRAIDDDLDLPVALSVVHEIATSTLDNGEKRWLILDADRILGLGLDVASPEDPVDFE